MPTSSRASRDRKNNSNNNQLRDGALSFSVRIMEENNGVPLHNIHKNWIFERTDKHKHTKNKWNDGLTIVAQI